MLIALAGCFWRDGAVLVGVLEEICFAVACSAVCANVLYWPLALLSAARFTRLSIFCSARNSPAPVAWSSGLVLLPRMLGGFVDFHALVPGFFNLTLAGVLLGLAYQRTGNLYFPSALHAGWIFWLKTYGAFTADSPRAAIWFWGTAK
jgi:membrane protease YdiL (CAAX protease family)